METREATKQENCNEFEEHQLSAMRSLVETRDLTSKEVDDMMLKRFLRARNLDVEKASALFLKYLNWRRTFVPDGFIAEPDIASELEQKKMFMQGYDKKQRPIGVALGRKHVPNKGKGGRDEFKRFVVYILDKICASIPSGQEKFTVIADLQGWGYSNCDIRAYLGALSILQDYYPERLGKLFLVHVPAAFITAWKIVCPFIDSNTKNKIEFVENNKLTSTLLQEIDQSQLPDIYGGQLPLVPIQDS